MPSVYFPAESGLVLYAKPSINSAVEVSSPWGGDAVTATESGSTGIYSFEAASSQDYLVFERAGASAASSDSLVASVPYLASGSASTGSSGNSTAESDITDVVSGDSFAGQTLTARGPDGLAINLTGATVVMVLSSGKRVIDTLSIGEGLSVVSASAGTFRIDAGTVSYSPTVLTYEVAVTTSGGTVYTTNKGRWPIL